MKIIISVIMSLLVATQICQSATTTTVQNTMMLNASDNITPISNAGKAKKKKVKKPIIIKFNSEFDLMVYSVDLDGLYTWDEGMKACDDLLAFGYDDWGMPTLDELRVIYENMKKVGNLIKTPYWSSTEPHKSGGNLADFINLYNGKKSHYSKQVKCKVRCVRKLSLK